MCNKLLPLKTKRGQINANINVGSKYVMTYCDGTSANSACYNSLSVGWRRICLTIGSDCGGWFKEVFKDITCKTN